MVIEHEISDLVQPALKGYLAFENLEGVEGETSLRIGAEVIQSMLNSNNDDTTPSITHPDGIVFTYAGEREKPFVTILDDITLQGAYFTDEMDGDTFPGTKILVLTRTPFPVE